MTVRVGRVLVRVRVTFRVGRVWIRVRVGLALVGLG